MGIMLPTPYSKDSSSLLGSIIFSITTLLASNVSNVQGNPTASLANVRFSNIIFEASPKVVFLFSRERMLRLMAYRFFPGIL